MCGEIRTRLAERYSGDLADGVRILYGGSVKAANAAEILAQPGRGRRAGRRGEPGRRRVRPDLPGGRPGRGAGGRARAVSDAGPDPGGGRRAGAAAGGALAAGRRARRRLPGRAATPARWTRPRCAGWTPAAPGSGSRPARRGGTLRLVSGAVDSLDPARSYSPGVWNVMRLYTRQLVAYAPKPGADGHPGGAGPGHRAGPQHRRRPDLDVHAAPGAALGGRLAR